MPEKSGDHKLAKERVTVVLKPDESASRFQIIIYGSDDDTVPIHTCRTRGEATSWLATQGYQWIEGSQPELWTRS